MHPLRESLLLNTVLSRAHSLAPSFLRNSSAATRPSLAAVTLKRHGRTSRTGRRSSSGPFTPSPKISSSTSQMLHGTR